MAEERSLTQQAAGWPAQTKDYFEELQLEMKRVTWPAWKQVRATTGGDRRGVRFRGLFLRGGRDLSAASITKLFDTFTK